MAVEEPNEKGTRDVEPCTTHRLVLGVRGPGVGLSVKEDVTPQDPTSSEGRSTVGGRCRGGQRCGGNEGRVRGDHQSRLIPSRKLLHTPSTGTTDEDLGKVSEVEEGGAESERPDGVGGTCPEETGRVLQDLVGP